MTIIKNIIRMTMAVAMLAFAAGCTKTDDDVVQNGSFEFPDAHFNYNFRATEEVVFIPVKTLVPETQWKITLPSEPWCHVSKSYESTKGLYLAVDANEDVDVRKTSFKVTDSYGVDYEFTVRQLGYGPAILVNNQVVSQSGGEVDIDVVTNIDITMGKLTIDEEDDADWITIENEGMPLTRAFAESTYRLYADFNNYPFEREAVIAFRAVDPKYNTDAITAYCTITQVTGTVEAGLFNGALQKEISKAYISVDETQCHSGEGTEYLIDDNEDTRYHSPWSIDNPITEFPVEWTFHFGNSPTPINVSYFTLYSKGGNGAPGSFNIEYKLKGSDEWVGMGMDKSKENPLGNFNQSGGRQTFRFPETLIDCTDLKIIWFDGKSDGTAECLCAQEIYFYEDLSSSVEELALRVFTDLSCTDLREGATRQDITALYQVSPYLAQEVAMRLYNGTYPEAEREYRIHEYEPYSNGENLYRTMRTRKYTQHDCPTGIYVSGGQKILVCVESIPAGQSVEFGVANEHSDSYSGQYNGFSQRTVLKAGFNEITVTRDGMSFIINRASELTSASKPVKVHILPGSGRVEGYFDISRHTDEDYVRLLNAASWKYFIARGQNIIFWMHTATLRKEAPTGIISGLSSWDDIVGWQFELMGIGKQVNGVWDRMIDKTHFNNHMVAVSSANPSAYMDASDYRINFSATSGIPKIISRELLLTAEDNTWGPAHEAGHVNQRAIMWKSNIESSNNLFSNYAIYKFGKYGSRGSMISDIAASFSDPSHKAWALMGSSTHMNEDTEVHMRMQWQLWNYFHRCGVDDQFWPKVFDLCRTTYILPNGEPDGTVNLGQCQMMFTQAVCDAAEMDFTDFFEVWGFWEPIDVTYEQYGSARYQVTSAQISQTKKAIADKGYPKAPAVQYIEDRDIKDGKQYSELGYDTTFRDKKTVSGTPTYTLEGQKVTVSGASNAVAIEIRRAGSSDDLGELLYFSNLTGFTIPSSISTSNVKVYAVQWDSKRIEATRK